MSTNQDHKIEINYDQISDAHKHFLDEIIHTSNANGVQLQLNNNDLVFCNSDVPCRGYFTDVPTPTLAVACDYSTDEWFTTLVHESCHMDQWLSNSPYWTAAKVLGIEAIAIIELWVQGHIELADDKKWQYIRLARNVELDCERRAFGKINRLNLPLDAELYAQRANAYILYYNAIGYTRSWYRPGKAPYDNKDIYSMLPKKIVLYDEWYEPSYMSDDLKAALISCVQ